MDRFWAKVDHTDTCWLWMGAISRRTGYGYFSLEGRLTLAHRASYRINVGPIPEGAVVMHRCDVKLCVRPDHLELGTDARNAADASARGLYRTGDAHPSRGREDWGTWPRRNREGYARGERQHSARLTTDQVRAIREAWANGASIRSLARDYAVDRGTVAGVVHRKTWVHV